MKLPTGSFANSWHKATLTKRDTEHCEEFNAIKIWIIPECPWTEHGDPVSIYDCNDCSFGVKGDYKNGTVWCYHKHFEEKNK